MKRIIILAIIALSTVIAVAENQTAVFLIKQMECNNCKGKVENVLAFEKGVRKLAFDVPNHLVTIVFNDAKTSTGALQEALSKQLEYKSLVLSVEAGVNMKAAERFATDKSDVEEHHDHHDHHGHNHEAEKAQKEEHHDHSKCSEHKEGCSKSCGKHK